MTLAVYHITYCNPHTGFDPSLFYAAILHEDAAEQFITSIKEDFGLDFVEDEAFTVSRMPDTVEDRGELEPDEKDFDLADYAD